MVLIAGASAVIQRRARRAASTGGPHRVGSGAASGAVRTSTLAGGAPRRAATLGVSGVSGVSGALPVGVGIVSAPVTGSLAGSLASRGW